MFKVYAFTESAEWSVDARTLEEARRIAASFERRNLDVRIYKFTVNAAGDTDEKLVGPNNHDF